MSRLAPVALFAYRRSDSLLRVLKALEACPEFAATSLHVYSDGPRTADARDDVMAVRSALSRYGHPKLTLVARERNFGLAASVIDAVSQLTASHGRVIVLEDDLLPGPLFLGWMNRALDHYESETRVLQIASHMFDVPEIAAGAKGVFLGHPSSKGWGVWERSWRDFDPTCIGWEEEFRNSGFRDRFLVGNAMRFEDMFRQQMAGRIDSWAIRFHYHVVRMEGLVLYPPMSLVTDCGLSAGKATHGQRTARFLPRAPLWRHDQLPGFPDTVARDEQAVTAWIRRLRCSPFGVASRLASWRYRLLVETGFLNR
jgi:hypothetical protein